LNALAKIEISAGRHFATQACDCFSAPSKMNPEYLRMEIAHVVAATLMLIIRSLASADEVDNPLF
jgi:hypothetical protein